MKATTVLRDEHEGIRLMLKILQVVTGKMKNGERVDMAHIHGILEFLSVFIDKCHHGKEEDYLFPALEAAGIPREGGPIGVMLTEHSEGRKLIARLNAAVAAYEAGQTSAAGEVHKAAGEYISLLNQHIDKEGDILFAMAEGRITAAEDDQLVERFEELERERIGVGKHEEFHAMIDQLSERYLP